MANNSIKLFISYSHDDDPYFKVFSEGFKKVVENAEHFKWSIWDDSNIFIGTFWDDEIQDNIKNCNVAMLLVSVGFMASKYIKESEYKEFVKQYKEKGILIVPIVFAPCDFNRWEDLSKLQFFKPKGSSYGKPEIENFTYADLIRYNERDGILIPNANISRYHLDLVKKIESSFKDFLNKTEEVTIPSITTFSNINKFSDYPKPSTLFTGRKTEVSEFEKAFDSFRVFAIEGLGGTGKTQFAAKCIEEIISNKERIIWLNGSVQSNFDVFVETSGYGDVLKGGKKSDLAMYSGFKDLIEKDERVIFWDNYNDYEDIAFSNFLSFTYQYLNKATIVLISKTEPSIAGILSLPMIRLEGLEEDAIEYAKKLRNANTRYSSISDLDLEKICNGADGHPLAIEFSMWLMGYGKTAEDIMAHMPELSGLKKVEEFSKRLFLDIFNHSKTSDEERHCFLMCSVFKEKISLSEIEFLYDGHDVFYLLAGLIDKLLISLKDGFYEMHPLVRSFSYEKLKDKKGVHKKVAEYFITQRTVDLNPALEEKIFYHLSEAEEWEIIADSIEVTGRDFIQQGQLGLLLEIKNKLSNLNIQRPIFDIFSGDIAEIKGEWDNAITHFDRARYRTEYKTISGEGMIKYGEMMYRKGNVQEALTIFEEAYEFTKQNKLAKEEARALNDLGIVYQRYGDLENAYQKLNEGLKIRTGIGDNDGIASSLSNIGLIHATRGETDKALNKFEESLKIYNRIGNKSGIAITLIGIGGMYSTFGNNETALMKFEESLKINSEISDKFGIAQSLSQIGSVYQDQGLNKEALEKVEESLKIFEEIGSKYGIASSLNSIGTLFLDDYKIDKALERFLKSQKIYAEIGDRAGVATSYSNIGTCFAGKGKRKEALLKFEESLKIRNEIGDKSGIAICICKIGQTYFEKDDVDEAIERYRQSIKIHEKIGDKLRISTVSRLIGVAYSSDKKKQYKEALDYLFKSISYDIQIGRDYSQSVEPIRKIRDRIGLNYFRTLAQEAYNNQPFETQKHIPFRELLNEPIQRETKIGRNDPCTCGSGKKYKQCHGKN